MITYLKKNYAILKTDILTMPNFFYKKKLTSNNLEKLKILKKNGYLNLGKLISEKSVEKAKGLIIKKIKNNEADFLDKQNIWKISKLDDFEFIVNEILGENLIHLIGDYFKRKIYLSDVDIRRVLPVDYEEIQKLGKSNSDWHRDTRGRQIKIMIYLSKVGRKDSFFSFIPNTHKNRTYHFEESRFSSNDIEKEKENEVKWFGNEGEAMIFDTNIKHRLNRQATASIRDTVTFYFTPGQALRKIYSNKIESKFSNNIKVSNILENSFFEERV